VLPEPLIVGEQAEGPEQPVDLVAAVRG